MMIRENLIRNLRDDYTAQQFRDVMLNLGISVPLQQPIRLAGMPRDCDCVLQKSAPKGVYTK
jgi:hypothetical protein